MNPLYNTNDSPNGATQPTKAVNREAVHVPNTHNTFDMSYFNYKTQKFGQYEPFFCMEGIPGDTIPFASSHNIRALPMSSPFLSSLKLNKDFFLIPNQAIQPNTWELIFKKPAQGDDVPDDVQNIFPLFVDKDLFVLRPLLNFICNPDEYSARSYEVLWAYLMLELFFSSGGLLYQLGYKLNPVFTIDGEATCSFDELFDRVFSDPEFYLMFKVNGSLYSSYDISVYQLLSLLRFYGSEVTDVNVTFGPTFDNLVVSNLPHFEDNTDYIRMDRVIAYQLACCQYYVNPNVDFIYNAQLYRDNLWNLLKLSCPHISIKTFDYNGSTVLYDYCCEFYYSYFMWNFFDEEGSDFAKGFDYLNALFGLRESLRFGDYFTDSRTRPLAPGENTVPVVDSSVDVIDMSRSIIYQRFRNAVVKLGNNFGDYLRGIFHTSPSPDYHIPKFIVHQDFDVSGFEVSNTTSSDQGAIVTNLNTQDDRHVFEIEIDMPCIILGISSFSIPRAYMQTKERFFMHKDRYDMFNPMLQYFGDQPVYNIERSDVFDNSTIFGYQSRFNEYKQRYSVVSGGFTNVLPAWTFVADPLYNPTLPDDLSENQSPAFIRAHDYEFNRFLSRVPGVSLGTGFHFIIVYNNKCVATRPLEVNPNTL